MAITITKEPTGIYPAFNDSFIEFNSDLTDNNKAEITVQPTATFTKKAILYPDSNGNYIFNLKEYVKFQLLTNRFKDSNYFVDQYYKNIEGLYLEQQITIEVFNDSTSESTNKTYYFFKAVKQIGESIYLNPYQLLSFSKDGVNYDLTYFEGFPFHFDIQKVAFTSGKTISIKNLNTGLTYNGIQPTEEGAFRINIDRGAGNNWTSENVLPLIEGLNRLELFYDGDFKTNILITKRKKCSGVYLKWFNRNGGYSHFLFDKYFINQIGGRNIDSVLKADFDNIEDLTGFVDSIGKVSSESLTIKAKYTEEEHEILKDIYNSPCVQMYSSMFENVEGRFIDVSIDGSLTNANKRLKNEIALIVNLPGLITATL